MARCSVGRQGAAVAGRPLGLSYPQLPFSPLSGSPSGLLSADNAHRTSGAQGAQARGGHRRGGRRAARRSAWCTGAADGEGTGAAAAIHGPASRTKSQLCTIMLFLMVCELCTIFVIDDYLVFFVLMGWRFYPMRGPGRGAGPRRGRGRGLIWPRISSRGRGWGGEVGGQGRGRSSPTRSRPAPLPSLVVCYMVSRRRALETERIRQYTKYYFPATECE